MEVRDSRSIFPLDRKGWDAENSGMVTRVLHYGRTPLIWGIVLALSVPPLLPLNLCICPAAERNVCCGIRGADESGSPCNGTARCHVATPCTCCHDGVQADAARRNSNGNRSNGGRRCCQQSSADRGNGSGPSSNPCNKSKCQCVDSAERVAVVDGPMQLGSLVAHVYLGGPEILLPFPADKFAATKLLCPCEITNNRRQARLCVWRN